MFAIPISDIYKDILPFRRASSPIKTLIILNILNNMNKYVFVENNWVFNNFI